MIVWTFALAVAVGTILVDLIDATARWVRRLTK